MNELINAELYGFDSELLANFPNALRMMGINRRYTSKDRRGWIPTYYNSKPFASYDLLRGKNFSKVIEGGVELTDVSGIVLTLTGNTEDGYTLNYPVIYPASLIGTPNVNPLFEMRESFEGEISCVLPALMEVDSDFADARKFENKTLIVENGFSEDYVIGAHKLSGYQMEIEVLSADVIDWRKSSKVVIKMDEEDKLETARFIVATNSFEQSATLSESEVTLYYDSAKAYNKIRVTIIQSFGSNGDKVSFTEIYDL